MSIHFDKKPGLVLYLTCGDPTPQLTADIAVAAIEAGADVIELGIPFSDPVADGPVIQRASERALKNHTGVVDVLKIARAIRERSDAGLVVFSYLNPLLRYGLERFCKDAASAGVDGVLVTDLPVDEAESYLGCMREHRLAPVFLAAPTSTDERLKRIAQLSDGFVYAVSRTGVTGAQKQMSGDAESLVKRIRRFTKLPVAVGFGVSNAEQLAVVAAYADAAVIGSAVMKLVEDNPKDAPAVVGQFVRKVLGKRSAAQGRKL